MQNLDKHSIQQSFSRRAKEYETWATPQKQSAKQLVQLLNPNSLSPKARILDAGCGTGFLTRFLLKEYQEYPEYPTPEVWGVDFSSEMLALYQNLSSNYRLGDLECLPFEDHFFTHCISSFALHWTSLERSLPELSRVSSCFLSLAIPIHGSLNASLNAFSFPFPHEKQILSLSQKQGSILFKKKQTLTIPYQGLELLQYFHHTGTSFPSQKPGLKPNTQTHIWKQQYKNQKLQYQILYLLLAK